jgi:hypothetical protein
MEHGPPSAFKAQRRRDGHAQKPAGRGEQETGERKDRQVRVEGKAPGAPEHKGGLDGHQVGQYEFPGEVLGAREAAAQGPSRGEGGDDHELEQDERRGKRHLSGTAAPPSL